MLTDPFSLKSQSKLSPRRLAFTAHARAMDFLSRQNFDTYELPQKALTDLPDLPGSIDWDDTSVTKVQMQHLLRALDDTERLGGSVIEVGCYRGVTTVALAARTVRKVVAVDPFLGGWGATNTDFDAFQARVAVSSNVAHVRATSGAAAANWSDGNASLIFIDAVHDYANTSFDISVWWPKLIPGGIMAFHDTDDSRFAGTRRAVYELHGRGAELYAHPDNITLLRKD